MSDYIYFRCSKWTPVNSGNTTAEEVVIEDTENTFQQKEDKIVPDLSERKNETGLNDETVSLLQQQSEKLEAKQLPDYYLLPRTECVEWTTDVNQSPKLSFIDNTLEY